MDRISLKALERTVLGKKVKTLRSNGQVPGHVFGKGLETEHVSVNAKEFIKVFHEAGETGVIDLQIGEEKVRPVMVRNVQYHAVSGDLLNIDFYQVNLKQKVTVPVPLVLVGDEPESVKLGEAIILQSLNEVSVEALPTDLIEKIEVNILPLKNVDDVITVGQLSYDHDKLTIHTDPEEIVVKMAPAVTQEMQELLEEQAAEAAAAAEETKEGQEGENVTEQQEGEIEGTKEQIETETETPKEDTDSKE